MCAKGNKFAYQNMLNRIREHKITKNKNLSVNFEENERAAWNSAIELCYNIVEKRRQNVEQGIKTALILSDVVGQREQFDKFYAWLDGLSQGEYDDMSLTDKCEKFFFKT